jgi:hypothetical protein
MPRITTVEQRYPPVPGKGPALWTAHYCWSRKDIPKFTPTQIVNTVITRARVDHGRWMADCPFCPSAQIISKDDRRYFCPECVMEKIGGAMVHVVWPSDDKVAEIERLLLRRPRPAAMGWMPNQSVSELAIENVEHGVGV